MYVSVYATFVILKGTVHPTERPTVYVAVYVSVYATFVILKGTVHSTGEFPLDLPLVERTVPFRMTKVAYTVDYTETYTVECSAAYTFEPGFTGLKKDYQDSAPLPSANPVNPFLILSILVQTSPAPSTKPKKNRRLRRTKKIKKQRVKK